MADDVVKEQTLGLNTDLPPDRLGQAAFSNTNLVPASAVSLVPRGGETMVGHYTLGSQGRALYIDTAPGRTDGSLIIVAVNRDGSSVNTIDGIYRHGQNVSPFGMVELDPDAIGGIDWSSGGNTGRMAFIYGWTYRTPPGGADPMYPVKVNVAQNVMSTTTYTDDFGDTATDIPMAAAVTPIRRLDSTYRTYGVFAVMLMRNASPNTSILRYFYDMDDDDEMSITHTSTVSTVLPSALKNRINASGIVPLQNGFNAYICWYPTVDADPPNCTIEAYVRTSVDTALGNRRTVEEQKTLATTEWVTDICPFSRQSSMYFLVAYGKTLDAQSASGYYDFGGNPADGTTMVVASVPATFKDTPGAAPDIQRGGTLADSLTNAMTTLNAMTTGIFSTLTAAVQESNTRLRFTHDVGGTAGNATTLTGTAGTPSGATMTGGTDAESHLMQYKLTINDTDWPEDPTDDDLIAFTDQWDGGIAIDHSGWLTRPDTVLVVQPTPAISGLQNWIVLLMGNFYEDTMTLGVTEPRLVLMDFDGVAQYTHTTFYGKAWGMCLNQYGEIYVTATKEIMGGKDYLICRYDSRFTDFAVGEFGELQAYVQHGQDGLGDYTEDPEATRVLCPIWDGERLTVQDHSGTSTYAYVYDRDLNFLHKYEVETDDPSDGKRWLVSRFSTPWFGETY